MISIEGLHKADVLAALFNAARPQGLGFLHYKERTMDREEAERLLAQGSYFDYLEGRVIKTRISSDRDTIDEGLYDRDNGEGAAQKVIDELRATGQTSTQAIQNLHTSRRSAAIEEDAKYFETKTETVSDENCLYIRLGADELGSKALEAIKPYRGELLMFKNMLSATSLIMDLAQEVCKDLLGKEDDKVQDKFAAQATSVACYLTILFRDMPATIDTLQTEDYLVNSAIIALTGILVTEQGIDRTEVNEAFTRALENLKAK